MNRIAALLPAAALAALAATPVPAETLDLPLFGTVSVVDFVDCTQADHRFEEFPAGASHVEEVLGKPCRVLPVRDDGPSFLKWRLGEGKGVRPNAAYVVVLEYPDDAPRDYLVRNNANNSRRSFHTGAAIGDAWEARYVDHHPESLQIPQSQSYQLWTSLTYPGEKAKNLQENGLLDVATEGFDLILAQYKRANHPETKGLAATRIWLCEIPDEKALWTDIPFPPAGLPRRHIFWREEMSDGAAIEGDHPLVSGNHGLDWFEQKARAMKILGINTFCKEMLEFGHNQHWDCNWKHGQPGGKSWKWMWPSKGPTAAIWNDIVPMAVDKYGLDILPYYEYGGANGQQDPNDRTLALGTQKRAEPLSGPGNNYTHITWSEGKLRVDITDPDAFQELCYILEGTILRYKDQVAKGGFAGAWFRPRPGEWAVSFADATRARFAKEANGGKAVSRDDLRRDKDLYNRYIDWYGVKRADFCARLQKYLADNGVKNPIVILDNDSSEGGPGLAGRGGLVTDDPETWKALLPGKSIVDIRDPALVSDHLYLKDLKTPASTWGNWEWQHACPGDDPQHYAKLKNVWISMTIHRLFSVNDPAVFDAYRNGNGTDTVIRHYGLNENMIEGKIGYCIADFERAGRACMMAEVNAMANGDPVNLGYLMGSNFTRGFPGPVREFNLNFLALPALPSKAVPGACDDPDVTLRLIDCGSRGTYYALVHTGWTEKTGVTVRFPRGTTSLTAIVSGQKAKVSGDGTVTIGRLQPWQLVSFRAGL